MDESVVGLVVRTLNELRDADPLAATYLVAQSVPCNAAVAQHERLICRETLSPEGKPSHWLGLLGVLNAVVRVTDPTFRVAAAFDEETGALLEFRKVAVAAITQTGVV